MTEEILLQLAGVIVLGIAAQWLASRLRVPAILLLLFAGFIAGPVTGFLKTDELLGDLLFPFVSVAVGVILFEGGLSLKLAELRHAGQVVRNLISVGALVTWVLSTAFAYWILNFDLLLAVQLGAILVVTGPTVVIPLLRFVRPSGVAASILRWEGILIDPVGATLALLVFEFISEGDPSHALPSILTSILLTILAGGVLGYLAARFLEIALRRYWVPDHLQTAVTLMVVVGVFVLSNLIQHESGLLATTIMGIVLANQKSVPVRHLVEFKENLGVLLLTSLFILLAARLELSDLTTVGLESLLFLAALVLVVRPVTVLVSTLRSGLTWRERVFMMWMAPRGIVAASVASVFSLQLVNNGYEAAAQLVPVTFVVIVGTCTVYGLTSLMLARRLGLSQPNPQGVLIVGGHPPALAMAQRLKALGLPVLVVDTNYSNVLAARIMGVPIQHGSILMESTQEDLDLQGIGYLLALTSNDEVNAWAAHLFASVFGRANVYQLAPKSTTIGEGEPPREIFGRLLFSKPLDYPTLIERYDQGGGLKSIDAKQIGAGALNGAANPGDVMPLFSWDGRRLTIHAADAPSVQSVPQVVISLTSREQRSESRSAGALSEIRLDPEPSTD